MQKSLFIVLLALIWLPSGLMAQESQLPFMTRHEIVSLAYQQLDNPRLHNAAEFLRTVWLLPESKKLAAFYQQSADWSPLDNLEALQHGDALLPPCQNNLGLSWEVAIFLGATQNGHYVFITCGVAGCRRLDVVPDQWLEPGLVALRRSNIEEATIVEGPTPNRRGIWATFYAQCDSRWGSDIMGTKTICQVGCLMTSMSMVISGYDPGDFNQWLRSHGGYSGNSFIWSSVDGCFGLDFVSRLTYRPAASDLRKWLDWGRIIVANIHNGGHWVLLLDHDGGTSFKCHDPGRSSGANNWISHSEIVGIGMYQ